MAKSISLKPKRELLNPNFDGYKLSLDGDVTVYSQNVNEGKFLIRLFVIIIPLSFLI